MAATGWDLDAPLLYFSDKDADAWRIRDACEGTQIFGATGSGKTSGSGRALAHAFLRNDFGGLVLCAKTDEPELWSRYAKETGREADLIRLSGEQFNFLHYEANRPGAGAGQTENLVTLFMQVAEIANQRHGHMTADMYWERAVKQLLRNAVDLLAIAQGTVSLPELFEIIRTAPQDMAEAQSEAWQGESICFDYIETEQRAGQAASHTLPQMLCSLHQLLRYKPENPASYLAFWYFAWKTELMAVFRSGPGISLMVVTDDVPRFMDFAAKFSNLADHFLMATTKEPIVVAEKQVLAIPPTWRFPASFPFLGIRKVKAESAEEGPNAEAETDAGPPNIRLSGPATVLPPYMFVSVPSDVPGEGHVSTPNPHYLPQEAIDLMTRRPVKELIRRRAVWYPSPRHDSKDAFLTDLRVAHERGLFPVYFDRLPTSDAVSAIGGVQITIPATALKPGAQALADKWKRALLKITRLQKSDAQAALLDLPDAFAIGGNSEAGSQLEVILFEFTEIGHKVIHPALLVR